MANATLIDTAPLERAFSTEHEFLTQFWSLDDLARRYRVSAKYIRRQVLAGKFPKGRIVMGRLRFLRSEVLAVEAEMLQGTTP